MSHDPKNLLFILDAIYKSIPPSTCKGLCQYECGKMQFMETEWEKVPINLRQNRYTIAESKKALLHRETLAKQGREHEIDPSTACDYLTSEGRCGIYDYRPTVCRVWGTFNTQMSKCPHGCSQVNTDEDQMFYMAILSLCEMDGSAEKIRNGEL